jgi:NAD(P)H-dependent FMN reductase
MPDLRLLLVTGSTRSASTNTAALRAAVELLTPEVDAVLHDGLAELPAFDLDRDRDPLPAPVARLRDEIGRAGGVVFCTPEYAARCRGR